MSRNRTIALVVWVVVTVALFIVGMVLLIFGAYFPEKDRIIMVSIAIAPVAMVAAMVGYGVWWLVLFVLSLFFPEESSDQSG
jgi:uncharacterized Tic20 family protein